jgi:hypothetical protein
LVHAIFNYSETFKARTDSKAFLTYFHFYALRAKERHENIKQFSTRQKNMEEVMPFSLYSEI